MNWSDIKRLPWKGLIPAIATIIAGNWAAEALGGGDLFVGWLPGIKDYKLATTAAALALFVISFSLLYSFRDAFSIVKTFSVTKAVPHRCLIIPLSPPWRRGREDDVKILDTGNKCVFVIAGKKGDIKVPAGALGQDIKALEETGWSWQQMMRGVEVHTAGGKLKQVYLIGSSDAPSQKGSYSTLCAAESLIRCYAGNVRKIHKHDTAVDFQDFDALMEALSAATSTLRNEGFHEADIIIDITGGQKPTSIAGAVVTLNSKVKFQYVETNPNEKGEYDVLVYDVVAQTPPSL